MIQYCISLYLQQPNGVKVSCQRKIGLSELWKSLSMLLDKEAHRKSKVIVWIPVPWKSLKVKTTNICWKPLTWLLWKHPQSVCVQNWCDIICTLERYKMATKKNISMEVRVLITWVWSFEAPEANTVNPYNDLQTGSVTASCMLKLWSSFFFILTVIIHLCFYSANNCRSSFVVYFTSFASTSNGQTSCFCSFIMEFYTTFFFFFMLCYFNTHSFTKVCSWVLIDLWAWSNNICTKRKT